MEESQALENYADDIDHKAATAPVIFPGSTQIETRGQLVGSWSEKGWGSLFFNAYDVNFPWMSPMSFERCSFPLFSFNERCRFIHLPFRDGRLPLHSTDRPSMVRFLSHAR